MRSMRLYGAASVALTTLCVVSLAAEAPGIAGPGSPGSPTVAAPAIELDTRLLDAAGIVLADPGVSVPVVPIDEALSVVRSSEFPPDLTLGLPQASLHAVTNDPARGGELEPGNSSGGYERLGWVVVYASSTPSVHQPGARASDAPPLSTYTSDDCNMLFVVDALTSELLDAVQVCLSSE